MLFVLAFIILYLPLTIIYPTKVIGKKNLPKKKRCIATSNHYTNIDPILYDIKLVKKFHFLAKVELFKNKLLGWFLKKCGGIPVDRENVSPSSFKETISQLKKNRQVFIFPEGTRNKAGTEQMADAKAGVITFASKGEADIIPMLLYRPPKAFRKNYIIIGEPFKLESENTKRLSKEEMQHNLERYEETIKKLRIELDEFVESKKKKKSKDKNIKASNSKSIKF